MTTVFHAWPYYTFMKIKGNLRRKKLYRTNQNSNFLEAVFVIETMQEPNSNLDEKDY